MAFVPLKWLGEHVELPADMTAQRLAADLVRVGLEEEQIVPPAVRGPLVVGRVLSLVKETHKNGKTINYCRVDVGEHNDQPGEGKEPADVASRGIVCGAHNFDVGDLVVVSLPGAVLPGDFRIAARKTYGHVSDGMICSERELGLGQDHSGILVLTRKFAAADIPAPGQSVLGLLGLGEEVLEINITPDRGYCFSMRGIAREYSHSTGAAFTDPGLPAALEAGEVAPASADGFGVVIEDAAPIRGNVGCDRFVTRIVEGADPAAATPKWMAERLQAAGMRPISLVVDVTNYVMLDLGQPMHAYDLASVSAPLVVRRARAGERLETLDEVERVLDPQDLVIADSPGIGATPGSRVVGLAGVMGGASSQIGAGSGSILLEAAHFDPVSIARSARRHKLPSEAAKRFERGVDPSLPGVAAQRAAELIVRYAGGTISTRVSDVDNVPAPRSIRMVADHPARLVGVDYDADTVTRILRMIGCRVADVDGELRVTPPSWRPDLAQPADLVEEVARLDGYDNIPALLPVAPAGPGLAPALRARADVARGLADAGLTQVLSYPFVGDAHDRQQLDEDDPRRRAVRIANPLAADAPALRTSLLDTLLPVAERNVARGNEDLAIYEVGTVTLGERLTACPIPSAKQRPSAAQQRALEQGTPHQPWHVAAVLRGQVSPIGTLAAKRAYDWADAIEVVRRVGAILGLDLVVENAAGPRAPFHPGRLARIGLGRDTVGYAGQLHPAVSAGYGLGQVAAALELDLSALVDAALAQPPVEVTKISTYPLVKEDVAFEVAADVPAARVAAELAAALPAALVEAIDLFDVYTGEQLGSGRKSLAFAVRLRAADRTLKAKEIAKLRRKMVGRVEHVLDAKLRA